MADSKETKYLKAFGKRVAEIRRKRGLTQEQLAELAEMTTLSLGFIEQGRRWPRLATIHRLANCLEVSVSELFK